MDVFERPEPVTPALLAFDNWKVNLLALPLVAGLAWAVSLTPLGFLMQGFHVWMHEFGHATAAWMTGRKATPLPIGWTPIEDEYSPFVYFGVLALLGTLLVSGWHERKIWPMLIAVALAALQYQLTWRTPLYRQEFWWSFSGIGGEFYLSTLLIGAFYVQLPDKFKWGACRWVFLFIGASCFLHIYLFWRDVYHGLEDIPMGSLIMGEDDTNGDMNRLMTEHGWSHSMIRRNYYTLGNACITALVVIYAAFALRLNRVADLLAEKLARPTPGTG
ncbi:MAG: M50 family metallopeptidase [Cephaloticoccus sp.]|nr:M50 family metallopeptidase [Cephaloticoccus sp.]MCF7759359.1 M50 family metallopeptidase [Cephaloticoccus sp.]